MFWTGHSDTKACPPTPSRLFPVPPRREVGVDVQLGKELNANKNK